MSPLNKRKQCGKALHPRKNAMDFQRVGQVRAKKKSMDEEMEICSRKKRNVEHRSDIVNHSIPYNRGI